MSRRFGRNQKRHMREQIAAEQRLAERLTLAIEMDRELLRRATSELLDYKDFFIEVAREVGKNARIAGIEPKYMQDMPNYDGWRALAPQVSHSFLSSANTPAPIMSSVQMEIMRILEVDAVRDALARKMHVRASLAGCKVAYAISESALHDMTKQELIELLTRELAPCLANAIKGE